MTRGEDDLKSTVKGVTFRLTPERLGQIWSLPTEGVAPQRPVDRDFSLRLITGLANVEGITKLEANSLSLEMRLLSHIVARIIFPKTGRFDLVPDRVIGIMDYIVRGVQLNLPLLIFRQMRDGIGRAKACLPYGMALTSVFREVGIDFEGELSVHLRHTDTYGEKTLTRMGYRKLNDRWVKRASGQELPQARDGAGPSQTADLPPAQPPTEPATDPFTTPPGPSVSTHPPPDQTVDDQAARITHTILDGLRPQMEGIQTEIARLASEVGRLTRLMEQRERSSMSSDMVTSLLASMGQLVEILKTHAPPGSAAAAAAEAAAAEAAEAAASTAAAGTVEAEPDISFVPPPVSEPPPSAPDQPPTTQPPPRPLRTYSRAGGPSTRTRSRRVTRASSSTTLDIPSD